MKTRVKQALNFIMQGFFWSSGAMLALFILFFVFKGVLGLDRLAAFKNSFFISSAPEEQDITKKLNELAEFGRITSLDSLFTQTLAYYDTLITILVGILGVAVAGAFFYIRSASLEKSKEYAEKHVDNFLETQKFNNKVREFAGRHADSWAEDLTQGFERISKLEERISSLEESAEKDAGESLEEA